MKSHFALLGVAVLGLVLGSLPVGSGVPSLAGQVGDGKDHTTLLVMFRDGALPADLAPFAAQHAARVADVWDNLGGAVLKVDNAADGEALLAALLARGDVLTAEYDFAWHVDAVPNDPRWGLQWGPKAIHADAAWDTTYGSHDVRLAILDTGVWGQLVGSTPVWHQDVGANVCGDKNFLGSGHAFDDNDHGSHTAGIATGVTNNGVGIAGTSQSCLYTGKVCDDQGNCDISKVGGGINWALNPDGNGRVDIVSMSFGGPLPSSTLQVAMDVGYARGLLLVASAGNSNCAPVGYPAAYDSVIAVAALQTPPVVGIVLNLVNGQTEIRAPYSNCGIQMELAAPGTGILSSVRNNGYASFDGTSMAAPFVAGVAGLVKAANPSLTNVQLRCVLDQTAQDYGVPKRDVEFGYGKVRADKAVAYALDPDVGLCVNYMFGLGIGGQNLGLVQTPPL